MVNDMKKQSHIPKTDKQKKRRNHPVGPDMSRKILGILLMITLLIAAILYVSLQNRDKVLNTRGSIPTPSLAENNLYISSTPELSPQVSDAVTAIPTGVNTYMLSLSPTPPYYGESTNGSCSGLSDCIVSGCSSEICQSKKEETRMSVCMYREDTPKNLGYHCGCVNQKCGWTK